MKKFLALILALVMALSLVACGKEAAPVDEVREAALDTPLAECGVVSDVWDGNTEGMNKDVKIGVILVGDENEGYSFAHIDGIRKAMAACGLTDDNMIWCYNIPENEECYDKCIECVEEGCGLIITNSYSHQTYTQQAAEENPEVQFVAMTGDTALASGLDNLHNAFNATYESRYLSGIVAGMKLKELMDAGTVTDPYIGYVGAYPYAEVVSGYTGFFLGIKSIVPEAHMDVQYTNSWFDQQEEGKAAEALMGRGCVIIGQHADSTGAPAAVQAAKDAGKSVYSVGYNVDMLSVAPTAALTSSTNDWSIFYTYLFSQFMKAQDIATNWAGGSEVNAVCITPLGPEVAEGTAEAVAAADAAIKAGTLHVFDTKSFTMAKCKDASYATDDDGHVVVACAVDTDGNFAADTANAVIDGYYHESYNQSAPSFALRIDGITELNAG